MLFLFLLYAICTDLSSLFCWAIDRRTQFTLQQFSHTKPKKHAVHTDRVQILGAVNQIRTGDLFLTKEVLYQLSYNSISFIVLPYCSPAAFGESTYIIIAQIFQSVNEFFLFWKKECFCRLKFVLFDDSDQFRWNSTCCICKEKR